MSKYVFTYTGTGDMPDTEEGVAEVMAAWSAWFGDLGAAVVDGGNPFGQAKSVATDGSVGDGAADGLSGYSVVTADDIDAAVAMAKGCPVLAAGGSVNVHEAIEM